MDKLHQFLEFVPLPVLLAAPILGALIFLLTPPRLRLPVALVAVVPYLTIGRLPGLGPPYLLCKATGWAALIAVAAAAIMQPGPKRRPHWITLVYLSVAVISPVYVLTADDNLFALAIRAQWITMVVAAIAVTRTIHDGPSLERAIRCLQIGFAIALLVPLADLLIRGTGSLRPGMGRFEPFEANANQIGIFLSQGFVWNLYAALRDRIVALRPVWAGFAAAALGMALLSGSRSTLVACVFPAIPLAMLGMRRPMFVLASLPIMALVALYVVRQVDEYAFHRLASLESARGVQGLAYIKYAIAERPLFGLMGTNGLNSEVDEVVGTHPHNAYLWIAYIGGLSFLIPMLFLVGVSMLSAAYVWRIRRRFDADPVLISTMCFMMIMVYAHGFESHTIYYPTYVWAFMNVLLSLTLTTMAAEAFRLRHASEQQALRAPPALA